MISQSVQDSICKQVNNELTAAYLYMSMVAYFEERNLHGMANWMRLQTQEEVQHAQRLFNHVLTRGGHVSLEAIPQPQGEFASPLEVFQIALAHEQKVTAEINALYELALLYRRTGQLNKARQRVQQALATKLDAEQRQLFLRQLQELGH